MNREEMVQALRAGNLKPVLFGQSGHCCVCGKGIKNTVKSCKLYTCGGKCGKEYKLAAQSVRNANNYCSARNRTTRVERSVQNCVHTDYASTDPWLVVTSDGYVSNSDPMYGF